MSTAIRFLVDEDFDNDILRGVLRRKPDLDIVRNGLPMPGVFAVSQSIPIAQAIADILLLAEYSIAGEWENQVRYLPL